MILLNYGHTLTNDQIKQVQELIGVLPKIQNIPSFVDRDQPLEMIVQRLMEQTGLTTREWEITPIVINPPPLAPLALGLVAAIHGRVGRFVGILNIRPIKGSNPPRYEVSEIVNLQAVRESERQKRH